LEEEVCSTGNSTSAYPSPLASATTTSEAPEGTLNRRGSMEV
jgi:hypothetical protein